MVILHVMQFRGAVFSLSKMAKALCREILEILLDSFGFCFKCVR